MEKEIISKFKEKPRTKIAWWTMGLGLGAILGGPMLNIFVAFVRPIAFNSMFVSLPLSVSALVTGVRAFKKGERSWVLWVGFVPAILVGAFWVFMIINEFIFPHH